MEDVSFSSVLAAVAVAAVTAVGIRQAWNYLSPARRPLDSGEIALPLLIGETTGMINVSSVSSVTFFDGSLDIEDLKKKVRQIVALNPWLRSKLRTMPNGEIMAVYSDETKTNSSSTADLADCVFLSSERLDDLAQMTYEEVFDTFGKYVIKRGVDCLDRPSESLFRVTLVELHRDDTRSTSDNKRFALVFSISHVIADGHTFYKIYGMLSHERTPYSLTSARNVNFMDDLTRAVGPKVQSWLRSPQLIIGFVKTLLFGKQSTIETVLIKQDVISSIKQKFGQSGQSGKAQDSIGIDAEFISTNDIITATFFERCQATFGFMAINFRNKLQGYTDLMAGNYESILVYNREDFSPEVIRHSVKTYQTKSKEVPTFLETIVFNCAGITNWTSFYSDLKFPHAQQHIHLPLQSYRENVCLNFGIIFTPREGEVALLSMSRTVKSLDLQYFGNKLLLSKK